jgi:hypothetical protein
MVSAAMWRHKLNLKLPFLTQLVGWINLFALSCLSGLNSTALTTGQRQSGVVPCLATISDEDVIQAAVTLTLNELMLCVSGGSTYNS